MVKRMVVVGAILIGMTMTAPATRSQADQSHKAGSVWVTLSDSWSIVATEGPQLMQATLPPQTTLFVWKFRSGGLSVDEFVPNLAREWGWTDVAVQADAAMLDPRFGQVHSWLYRKAALYGSFDHYNKVYAFRDDAGEIMILQFQCPDNQYAALGGEFLSVFTRLSTAAVPAFAAGAASAGKSPMQAPKPKQITLPSPAATPPASKPPVGATGRSPAQSQGDIWSEMREDVADVGPRRAAPPPAMPAPKQAAPAQPSLVVKPPAPASAKATAGSAAVATAKAAKPSITASPAIPDFRKDARPALPAASTSASSGSTPSPQTDRTPTIGESTPSPADVEMRPVPPMDAHGEVARMVNTILSAPPTPALPIDVISRFTYYRETDDGVLGFDLAANTVSLLDVEFKPVTTVPLPGTPYFTDLGIYFLTEKYAYQIQIRGGELATEREDIFLFLNRRRQWASVIPLSEEKMPETWSVDEGARRAVPLGGTAAGIVGGGGDVGAQRAVPSQPDPVLTVLNEARAVHRAKGAKAATEVLLMDKARLEATHSVHLYDYYFTLGEYWEEMGDLDTALTYYRQGARMMD